MDFKDAFRAAVGSKAQKPTKEQLGAMKAQKVQQAVVSSGATKAAPPPSAAPSGLPPGFFDAGAPSAPAQAARPAAPARAPAAGLVGYGGGGDSDDEHGDAAPARPGPVISSAGPSGRGGAAPTSAPHSALPKGFFDDVASDKKARGLEPPKAKDVKEDWDDFQAEIQAELEEQARQAAEAERAAEEDKEERDELTHLIRLAHVEALKDAAAKLGAAKRGRDEADGAPGPSASAAPLESRLEPAAAAALDPDAALAEETLRRVREGARVKRARLAAVDLGLAAVGAGEESDSEGSEGVENLLDWRLKKV